MSKKEKPIMTDLISRSFEYRVVENEEGVLEGTPIVFNTRTDIGGWYEEMIEAGAVSTQVLRDVAFFFNHDIETSKKLASTKNGTLELTVDEKGVHMRTKLNLERTDSKDLYLAIKDGEIDEMSFMFRIEDEEWRNLESDYPTRIIKKIGYIQEVSAVNWGAYSSTEIYARGDKSVDTDFKALDNARAKAMDIANNLMLEKAKIKAKLGMEV